MLAPRGPNAAKVNIQNAKQRLFDIGYSVSATAVPRAQLTTTVDDGLLRALAAFQLRILDHAERGLIQIPVQAQPNSGVVSNPGFIWIDFATAAALVHISDHI